MRENKNQQKEVLKPSYKLAKVEKVCCGVAFLCKVGEIVFIFIGGILLLFSVLGMLHISNLKWMKLTVLDTVNNMIIPLNTMIPLDKFSFVDRIIAIMGSVGIIALLWAYMLSSIHKIFIGIVKGRTPFNLHYIKKLRILSLIIFLAGICQPIFIFLALVILCITNIFEYGNALEIKASQTMKIQEQVILAFAEITEAKSGQTGQHVKRVSEYSRVIAKGLELPEEEVEQIQIASMMHDVGKIMIPSEILEKPGKLTNQEFDIIKTHISTGEHLLHNALGDIMEKARIIALEHHEKWNGEGYLGKCRDEISLEGRIVAVADVFDALVSKRSYKKPWSPEEAFQKIVSESGEHFDPNIVTVFQNRYDEILHVLQQYQN